LESEQTFIEDLGFDTNRRRFLDLADNEVRTYFKLYPWEWMWREPFAEHLKLELIQFIEPMWKMLLSNKGLLAVLWELYPGHPNLLPAFWTQEDCLKACGDRGYVRKPMLSREGANIQIVRGGEVVIETEGDYGGELQVYQALAAIPTFDGKHPVMGAWVVNHEACGLGIREDDTLVTGNLSRFVPHIFF
jgi:glutathionylspermidine synthase